MKTGLDFAHHMNSKHVLYNIMICKYDWKQKYTALIVIIYCTFYFNIFGLVLSLLKLTDIAKLAI